MLGDNEAVTVLAKYAVSIFRLFGTHVLFFANRTLQPWDGVYMFHCHNTIHEDHDMVTATAFVLVA